MSVRIGLESGTPDRLEATRRSLFAHLGKPA
jgi:hypothetical protein